MAWSYPCFTDGMDAVDSGHGADALAGVPVVTPPPTSRERTVRPSTYVPESVAPPETLRYRLKNKLLGPPLASERQASERLGRPTALAVLSSDVISSSASATAQLLIPLLPLVGEAGGSLV